jgi:hypothetical protein
VPAPCTSAVLTIRSRLPELPASGRSLDIGWRSPTCTPMCTMMQHAACTYAHAQPASWLLLLVLLILHVVVGHAVTHTEDEL